MFVCVLFLRFFWTWDERRVTEKFFFGGEAIYYGAVLFLWEHIFWIVFNASLRELEGMRKMEVSDGRYREVW